MNQLFNSSDLATMFPAIVLIVISLLLIGNKRKVYRVISGVKGFLG